MSRKRLVVIGPLPPPVHGVAVSTSLVLANRLLREKFDIEHLDTTDRRSISNLGKWDRTNVLLGLQNALDLARQLRGRPGLVYLPLSESAGGFLRDSLFIQLATIRGWKTAVHIRNSLFRHFYLSHGAVLRWWIRVTLQRITGLAVLGDSLRQLFDGLVPAERISVVPNGTPDFDPGPVEPDPHTVLYLSNLSRKKGADFAVRAAAEEARPDGVRVDTSLPGSVGRGSSEDRARGSRCRRSRRHDRPCNDRRDRNRRRGRLCARRPDPGAACGAAALAPSR